RHEPERVGDLHSLHAQGARRPRPDDSPDRARHEGRDGGLRVHHRPRPRREDRGGPPGGGPREPARRRGLPRKAGVLTMPMLALDGVHTFYGNIEALKGISLTVDEGEIVTL